MKMVNEMRRPFVLMGKKQFRAFIIVLFSLEGFTAHTFEVNYIHVGLQKIVNEFMALSVETIVS